MVPALLSKGPDMATIKCSSCKTYKDVSFFEPWYCNNCGDFYISYQKCSEEEIHDILDFLSSADIFYPNKLNNSTLLLVDTLWRNTWSTEPTVSNEPIALIDTSLLFFDSILIPYLSHSDIENLVGDNKWSKYYDAQLIKCVDHNLRSTYKFPNNPNIVAEMEFDYSLFPEVTGNSIPQNQKVYWLKLDTLITNLNNYYRTSFIDYLVDSEIVKHPYLKKLLDVVGVSEDAELEIEWLMEMGTDGVLKAELFCHLYGSKLLIDDYYQAANSFNNPYFQSSYTIDTEFNAFQKWMQSTLLEFKEMEPDDVLEFRDKYGTLSSYIRDLQLSIGHSNANYGSDEIIGEFCRKMDQHVSYSKRVMGKSHDRLAIYLTGLLSTFGSFIDGTVGALVGGVGGAVASQLLLEYSRRLPPQLSFISTKMVTDK